MNTEDFLYKLKKLPPDTPMTAIHIAAILETLSGNLKLKANTDFDSLSQSKLIDEEMLADWLGESPSTLQKWRVKGGGPQFVRLPKSVRYSVGAVRDWIETHTVSSTSEAHVKGLTKFETDEDFGKQSSSFLDLYPVIIYENKYLGFFRSLDNGCEIEPDGFKLVRVMTLSALQPPTVPENQNELKDLLVALNEMTNLIAKNPSEARKKYGDWEKRMTDTQRLGYFESALAFNLDFAKEIAEGFSHNFLAENFNPALWFWKNIVEQDEVNFCRENPVYACEYLKEIGVNINRPVEIVDAHNNEIFSGTVAHIMADTFAENFHLNYPNQESPYYQQLLLGLLENGLDVNSDDKSAKSPISIAEEINHSCGVQISLFAKGFNSFQLNKKLQASLSGETKEKFKQNF